MHRYYIYVCLAKRQLTKNLTKAHLNFKNQFVSTKNNVWQNEKFC